MKEERPNLRPFARWVRHGMIRIEDPGVRERLDRYLAGRYPYRSRTQWVHTIESGRVLVNGRRCRPSRTVRCGDRIDYVPKRQAEPPVAVTIPIVYEDDDLLGVNKPALLPVHPAGRYFRNTLLCLLLEARGETLDSPGIRIVHRLDRETSGIVLFGKTRRAAAFLSAQFEEHTVIKEYLALVAGVPPQDRFTVEAALGPNPQSRVRKAVGVVPAGEGRPAITEFEVLSRGGAHALVLARPRTGRLHQIRVHLKHAGHPIVGDKLYGVDEGLFLKLASGLEYDEEDRRRLLLGRQGLHAWRITVLHPRTSAPFTCSAPVPQDLSDLCLRLGVHWTPSV
jgi:23S rRNA pseudouridine1911/1915/1917 synthase